MKNSTGCILKSDQLKLDGRFLLEARLPGKQPDTRSPSRSAPAAAAVVENHPDFVIIEVTCGCGAKTLIRCQYTASQNAAESK
jgi:hypothetical protein